MQKKLLFVAFFAIVGCVAAVAGNNIKLTSGSIASLKDGGVGCVSIDMADTKYDNKKPLRHEALFAEVDNQLEECAAEFVREFNENSKKFVLTENPDEAAYQILVKITNLDSYVKVVSFKGGAGIKLWGTVTITDKATGEEVAEFTIDEEGNCGFTYQVALENGFEGIAKYLAKRIKKGK